jgi:hypothetical protein
MRVSLMNQVQLEGFDAIRGPLQVVLSMHHTVGVETKL